MIYRLNSLGLSIAGQRTESDLAMPLIQLFACDGVWLLLHKRLGRLLLVARGSWLVVRGSIHDSLSTIHEYKKTRKFVIFFWFRLADSEGDFIGH